MTVLRDPARWSITAAHDDQPMACLDSFALPRCTLRQGGSHNSEHMQVALSGHPSSPAQRKQAPIVSVTPGFSRRRARGHPRAPGSPGTVRHRHSGRTSDGLDCPDRYPDPSAHHRGSPWLRDRRASRRPHEGAAVLSPGRRDSSAGRGPAGTLRYLDIHPALRLALELSPDARSVDSGPDRGCCVLPTGQSCACEATVSISPPMPSFSSMDASARTSPASTFNSSIPNRRSCCGSSASDDAICTPGEEWSSFRQCQPVSRPRSSD